jgi:hypothetical protein
MVVARSPESQAGAAPSAVHVWIAASLLVVVTFVPTATRRVWGEKAKLWMVIVGGCVVAGFAVVAALAAGGAAVAGARTGAAVVAGAPALIGGAVVVTARATVVVTSAAVDVVVSATVVDVAPDAASPA